MSPSKETVCGVLRAAEIRPRAPKYAAKSFCQRMFASCFGGEWASADSLELHRRLP